MIRRIITIDEEKCNGCGLCVSACHEGAIGLIEGKAKLLRDDYCDGLGNCLPACPTQAISFEEREAAPFDEKAVQARMAENNRPAAPLSPLPCGCPGSQARSLAQPAGTAEADEAQPRPSQLRQWPVQIKLAPVKAAFFEGADLLIAADCSAYAHGDFHRAFMRGKVTLIGCPKLDEGDYAEKLAAIIQNNTIASITLTRMEVPCCGGLERSLRLALAANGNSVPLRVVTLGVDGRVLEAPSKEHYRL
jgi:NAD-dependent dihydropyrimidine dehydrogenase PreA subunit